MPIPSGPPLPIVTSMVDARVRVAAGERMVVVVPVGQGDLAGVLLAEGGGVPAFLVGEPDDPAVLAAAAEMAAELGATQVGMGDGGRG